MISPTVYIALFGWLVIGPILAVVLGGRFGIAMSMLVGWLFLPIAGVEFGGLPDYDKTLAVMLGTLVGIALANGRAIQVSLPKPIDMPMLAWCLLPLASSLANGLGLWDGLSEVLQTTLMWGVPYLIGRLLFTTDKDLESLTAAIVIAGLIYVPLCLYEIRMSPQLHYRVYGFHQHQFAQNRRFEGWRPTVFLQHGLAVGLFMASCTIVATTLWLSGARRSILGLPMPAAAGILFLVTILCKSVGSIGLMLLALVAILLTRFAKWKIALYAMIVAVPLYVGLRASGAWSGQELVRMAEIIVPARAASLQTRIDAENLLAEHALQRPILGWGGHARNRVMSDQGFDQAITDGLWIIVLGKRGVLGLSLFVLLLMSPPAVSLWRLDRRTILLPRGAMVVSLAVIVTVFALDSLLNAMPNPVFPLAIGALACASARIRRTGQAPPTTARSTGLAQT